jgi:hypothetical protein
MHPVSRYAQDRHGQGRWVRLHRFGGTIGTLWTDDAQALGLIPEPGASVALLVNSIRSACAQGTPTSWVFDDHAAWSSQDHWGGPVERGDLATLGLNAPECDSCPFIAVTWTAGRTQEAPGWGLPPRPGVNTADICQRSGPHARGLDR